MNDDLTPVPGSMKEPGQDLVPVQENNPIADYVRAGVQGVLPIARTVSHIASNVFPADQTLAALDPLAGKNFPESIFAGVADTANTVSNLMAPAKGAVQQLIKFGLPVAGGVVSKYVGDELNKADWYKKAAQSPAGKIIGNYIMPAVSTALSAVPIANKLNEVKNITKQTEDAGFNAARGALGEASDENFNAMKNTLTKEHQQFGDFMNKANNVPIPIEKVQELVNGMQAAQAGLGVSEAGESGLSNAGKIISKKIDKSVTALQSLKNPTFEQIDRLAHNFKEDVIGEINPLSVKFEKTKGLDISNQFKDTLESSLPPELQPEYKAVKGSYASAAEAKNELEGVLSNSTDQIIKKINDGDKIDAIERLADPLKFDNAIRSYMKSKFSNDTGKMLSKYMEVLQNIDNNNPKLIDKMFNPNNLPLKPLTNTGVAATAAAGLPQTAESEENKSLQEATK